MTYSNDWKKLLIAEIKPGKQLQDATWTASHINISNSNNKLYFADQADQKVTNGNLETWTSATVPGTWTVSLAGTSTVNREGAIKYSGTYGLRCDVDAGNNNCRLYQNVTLVANAEYIFNLWYKNSMAGKTSCFRIYDAVAAKKLNISGVWIAGSAMVVLPNALVWTRVQFKFTMTANTVVQVLIGHTGGASSAASSSIYMDDCYICPKLTATLTNGNYTPVALCTEIDTAMAGAGSIGAYVISFYPITNAFRFDSANLLYLYTVGMANSIYSTIGFSIISDYDFSLDHTGGAMPFPANAIYSCLINFGEIIEVTFDGVQLLRKYSIADCIVTDSSFYYDFYGSLLHIYAQGLVYPGDWVSPGYVYSIVAFFWKCFSNRQAVGAEAVVFVPTGCTYPVLYDPVLRADSLNQLTAAVADHFESAMQTSTGGISLTNTEGWWYSAVDDFYWNNKDIRAKIGEIGDLYSALETIFIGKVRTPTVSDDAVTFEMVDGREGRLQSIPTLYFNLTDYPNLPDDALNRPIPVLFGEKTNISPVRISTAAYTFKISQTHFGSEVFELSSIDAVYFKGMTLSLATHYTVDLHNGEFTLTFDPEDGLVTCDAKGIEDEFDMATGLKTGVYSENVADHLFFVLHILNEMPVTDLRLVDFADLQAARTQKISWLLDTDTPTIDFNRLLQQTSLYHFLPLNDGTFTARYYRKTIPAGTLELRNFDHAGFKKTKQSDGVFRDVVLKYDKDPTTGVWQVVQHTENTVEQNHNSKEPYFVETALRDATEAASVLNFYVSLLKNPPTKIDTSISLIGSALLPTDKLYVNRNIVADGKAVTISTDEIYVILQTRKDLGNGRVGVTAQLDTQLAIYTTHADSPHGDVPHADHSDVVHNDASHGDHDDNLHSDITHVDVPHVDETYSDHTDDHDDFIYQDHSDDIIHTDSHGDSYLDHTDNPYSDTPHSDSHTDSYSDYPHEDGSHSDHTDTLHTDSHTDVSHIDSEV